MDYSEKTIKSDRIYEGKILNLRVETVELPDRKYSKREIVEFGDVAVIIAVRDDEILLVKNFRKTFDKVLTEVPAGHIESGETPIDAAKREFQEETGYKANNMDFITETYVSPGYSTEKMYFFMTTDFEKVESDELPELEVVFTKIEDLGNKIESLDIKDLKTVFSYQMIKDRK